MMPNVTCASLWRRFGDFSRYTLRLVRGSDTRAAPPAGFDPALVERSTSRSGSIARPSSTAGRAPPVRRQAVDEPELDYLAKDYATFRG